MELVIKMNHKILVELWIPDIDKAYEIFIPINRKIGNIISLLAKALKEETHNEFLVTNRMLLYDGHSGNPYPIDVLVHETNIKQGSRIILM